MTGVQTCALPILAVLFQSFLLPFVIMFSVPLAAVGGFAALFAVFIISLTSPTLPMQSLDVLTMLGFVILIGVVVNNAIVLVDMVNRLREAGMERLAAIVEAGRARFRPILMTTLTTIFGLVPMAVGTAKVVGLPYAPLGRTMIGGLLASTLLTLLIVPLFYLLLDDLREFAARVWASMSARSASATGSGAAAGVGRAGRAE